jgi:hypothetical protein
LVWSEVKGVDGMESTTLQDKIKYWTENEYFDPQTRQELLSITDPKELAERF